ncbi:MAG: hypothetical protein WAT23_03770 [Chromatiaceae bacterium]
MFLVSDSQQNRHDLIESFLKEDTATIAVILAAIDFEWTIRRAILALGCSPTKYIRLEVLGNKNMGSGPDAYKKAWNAEPYRNLRKRIDEVIPHWSRLKDPELGALRLRNQIVHGIRGTVSLPLATDKVQDFLKASKCLEQLAQENNTSLYRRITRRKTRKPPC